MQITYSHHLVTLVARVHAAATRIAGADPDARAALAETARRDAAVISALLDGSPLRDDTVERVDAGEVPVLDAIPEPGAGGTGWARVLKLDALETQEVAAIEYANLRALGAVEADLAGAILAHPLDTLGRLHGVVCQGLVEPDLIGVPRATEQAVHDGAQGRVIYNAMAPERITPALEALGEWITRRSITVPPVVVAGVVHQRLLEIQPYEAGNGRVARAATRVLLLAHGIDPHGAAVVEAPLWADASGYYGEVAATIRRGGDLQRWLERHTAAVATALEAAADALVPQLRPEPPERGRGVVDRLAEGRTISLRDYAEDVGVDLRTAHADLSAFVRAGQLADVPGGAGLRFARPATPDG